MKKVLAIAVLGSLLLVYKPNELRAQGKPPADLTKVVPATPNATKITDFYAQKPNMYTGTANISIPLYTIDFDGWNIPLSISYNATGVRVNEESSEIGLGWALSATGVISRQVNGADDFFDGGTSGFGKGYIVGDKEITAQMDYLDARQNGNSTIPPDPTTLYYALATKRIDTQPDVFNYNFFGYSGSFVLTRQLRGDIKVVKITQDACLISFNLAQKTFTVTTPNGFKGTFDIYERSTTLSSAPVTTTQALVFTCCDLTNIDLEYAKRASGQFRTITSWYLSKIVSPHGKELNFTYDLVQGRSYNISSTKSFAERTESTIGKTVCTQTIQEHVYLLSVLSDEVQVNFQMQSDRDDLRRNTIMLAGGEMDPLTAENFPTSSKLKRYSGLTAVGLNGSSLNKSIAFKQSYFNINRYNSTADNDTELEYLRLKLDRLTIDDQVYSFYYENPNGLPSKFSSGMDHFGFANGDISIPIGGLLPPVVVAPYATFQPDQLSDTLKTEYYSVRAGRQVNFESGKAGILSKVVYPTGGYSKFTFESHNYKPEPSLFVELSNNGFTAGGARIKTIEEFDYDNVLKRTREYYYVEDPNAATPVSTGRMMTPLYNRYPRVYKKRICINEVCNNEPISFEMKRRSFSGIPGSHAAQGKVIGYSKVYEKVKAAANDFYWNIYTFENNPSAVQAFAAFARGTPDVNGQVITTSNYSSGNRLIQTVVNSDYAHQLTGKVMGLIYEPQDNNTYLEYYVPYYIDRMFIQPYVVTTTTASTPGGSGPDLQVIVTNTYNDSTRMMTSQKIVNSLGEEVKTYYKRPFDYSTSSQLTDSLKAARIIDPVIEEIVYKGGQVVSAKANRYQVVTVGQNSFVNLKKSYLWNRSLGAFAGSADGAVFPAQYELKSTFNIYDDKGKIRQYTGTDGVVNSFVWGYNNTLPIVHGVNVTYTQLKAAYDASQGSNYETSIRNHANTLAAMITTYNHDPLVGIKKVTNPAGRKVSYNYDQYSRLKSVIDNDGNTLEQYELNYHKIEPVYAASISASQLNWGVLTNATEITEIYGDNYAKCTSYEREFSVTNTGNADIKFRTFLMNGGGFRADTQSGTILPGNSFPITVKFNPDGNLQNLPYTAQLAVEISRASDNVVVNTLVVNLSGELQQASCPPSSMTFDMGVTTQNVKAVQFNIPTGNVSFRMIGYSWIQNGAPIDPLMMSDFSISDRTMPTDCIIPDASTTNPKLGVNFHSVAPTQQPTSATFRVYTNSSCGNIDVLVRGWRREGDYAYHLKTELLGPSMIEPTMEDFLTTQVKLTNDGENDLMVSGITPTGTTTAKSKFTLSESNFYLPAGATKTITVTFTTGIEDLNQYDVSYSIVTSGVQASGTTTFAVSGKRRAYRAVEFSATQLVINGNDNGYINVKNIGNTSITFSSDFKYANVSGGSYSTQSNSWLAEFTSPLTVARNGIAQIRVHAKFPSEFVSQFIQVQYAKTDGPLGAADAIPVSSLNRNITMSGLSFGLYLNGSSPNYNQSSKTAKIENKGNTAVTINSITSTNSRFSISVPGGVSFPGYLLQPGTFFNATVTYSDNDYSEQSSTISVNSPDVNSNGSIYSMNVTARRDEVVDFSMDKTLIELKFSNSGSDRQVVIQNTGSVTFTVTLQVENATEYSATLGDNIALGPYQTKIITVEPLNTGDGLFYGPNSTLTITASGNGRTHQEKVYLSKSPDGH